MEKQLKIWRSVGIVAIVALAVVSALFVTSLTKNAANDGDTIPLASEATTDVPKNNKSHSPAVLPESDARVSYLGPAGTYTEEAARFFFAETKELLPQETVDDAIALVEDGKVDYAVIPQENTIGGAVTNYVDALIASENMYVVGEVILPIRQTLMGVPGATLADIETVCSHAQGIAQSADWRKEHLPDAVTEEMSSTAAAASYVAEQEDISIAAVAAPAAAELYGLEVLAENVQITDSNKTRFYVLSLSPSTISRLTNAVFIADCGADRIDDILVEIHDSGLEMVTIHDRPEKSALGRYLYVIEVTNPNGITDEQIEKIGSINEVRYAGSFDSVERGAE